MTDRTVAETIDGGAHTVEAVTKACGAGGDCGACRGKIEEMIEDRTVVPIARLVRERAA